MVDIITIILIAYALATPFFYSKAIKYGVKLASEPEKVADEPMFHVPTPKKPVKMTEEEQRRAAILANIERYDGTSNGQKPIKE